MRSIRFSVLLASVAAIASVASAQAPPSEPAAPTGPPASSYAPVGTVDLGSIQPQWDGDSWRQIPGPALGASIEIGVSALKDKDYARAEKVFGKILKGKPTHADANFYMGVAEMNLGQWEDAKKRLEIAAREKPKHPDPKSRLGVTYAKLGDTAGAYAQRAELMKMADACKGDCRLSPYIAGGIEMIDEALAEPSGANPASLG